VLPLTFIALVLPAIKDRLTATAALSAGGTAVFVAAMPLNLGLITAALVGVLGGLVARTWQEGGGDEHPGVVADHTRSGRCHLRAAPLLHRASGTDTDPSTLRQGAAVRAGRRC
jgi:hypothetical protein